MGYRGYITHDPSWGPGDPCLGKLYGYANTDDCAQSLRLLVQALRDTPQDLTFNTYEVHSVDTIQDMPEGVPIMETLDNWFDSSYLLIVRFPKILFCEWLKAYHHEHITYRLTEATERTNLRDILEFYQIKLKPLENYVYVYWM